MFGYLAADSSCLTEAESERYRACYCGLCRSLKESRGQISRLTLNFDMTFLILLLNSLYEPEETSGENACIAHPLKGKKWWKSEFSEYAAEMNVALAWLKCRDDIADEKKLSGYLGAAAYRKSFESIKSKYPRQVGAMEESIRRLRETEQAHEENPDKAAASFGYLMGSVFVFREDEWKEPLFALGDWLGRTVYLLDACMDLEDDAASGNYNPLKKYAGQENGERFREYLKLYLSEAVGWFEYLPIVKDYSILRNILCAGTWQKFNRKYPLPEPGGEQNQA